MVSGPWNPCRYGDSPPPWFACARACAASVPVLTGMPFTQVYAFSIENFKRSPDEVAALMNLAEEKLNELAAEKGLLRAIYAHMHTPVRQGMLKSMFARAYVSLHTQTHTQVALVPILSCEHFVYDRFPGPQWGAYPGAGRPGTAVRKRSSCR